MRHGVFFNILEVHFIRQIYCVLPVLILVRFSYVFLIWVVINRGSCLTSFLCRSYFAFWIWIKLTVLCVYDICVLTFFVQVDIVFDFLGGLIMIYSIFLTLSTVLLYCSLIKLYMSWSRSWVHSCFLVFWLGIHGFLYFHMRLSFPLLKSVLIIVSLFM